MLEQVILRSQKFWTGPFEQTPSKMGPRARAEKASK